MAMSSKGPRATMSEINVTPMVDVMLVLLIIFMVTAPMLTQGINLKLPQASSQDIDAEESYVISITAKADYYFNQDLVTLPELERRLRILSDRGIMKTVFLRADRTVPYGVVVTAIDLIKKAGIEQLGIVTEPFDTTL
jgi:biopolymer transport protein TolR